MSTAYRAWVAAKYSLAETIGNDGIQLLISIYESSTTPQWLRQIPAIEILRQTWLHQYYIDYTDVPLGTTGRLRWRNVADLPKAGNRFDSPYDTDARYANKRSTTWTGYVELVVLILTRASVDKTRLRVHWVDVNFRATEQLVLAGDHTAWPRLEAVFYTINNCDCLRQSFALKCLCPTVSLFPVARLPDHF